MLPATHRIHERSAALPTFATKSKTDSSSAGGSDTGATSFGDQLANALETFMNQSSDGSPVEFTITPESGQDSGTRQFVVTLKSSTDAATAASTPTYTPNVVNYGAMSPFDYGAAKYASEHPDDPTGVQAASTASAEPEKPANETDAYWAQFPEPVQALRNIPNRDDRIAAAWGLVQQGYTVDAEIMVLGNDPYATMLMRQQNGYTWTPAMGQPPIDLQPGLQMAGHQPYDPLHPPAGSIPVSLDFAKGLESTSPAMRQFVTVTT